MNAFTFEPIGRIHSCFPEKFGIPRQPGLVPEACASVEMLPPYQRIEAFRELDKFSHIWIIFVFHRSQNGHCNPTVRPPRLGGNRRVGVFASRSGFRPNPIGQSVVELTGVERRLNGLWLNLKGIDLLDGTPVLDIKPYIAYADHVPHARCAYAPRPPAAMTVEFTPKALGTCRRLEGPSYPRLQSLIAKLIALDPRPAYNRDPDATFGMGLWDLNIRFRMHDRTAEITGIQRRRNSD